MKVCTSCKTAKAFEMFSPSPQGRDGYRAQCKACRVRSAVAYQQKHKEKHNLANKKYRQAHPDRMRESVAKCLSNPERAAKHKAYCQQFRKSNGPYYAYKCAEYRLKKKQGSIATRFSNEILEFYRNAPSGMQVDHIIPIRSANVCGLHVPWNLQYLSVRDNRKKGSKFNFTYENKVL